MSIITVSKTEFKPKAFEYLRRVEEQHDTIRVTDHGRPVAEVVPYGQPSREALNSLRGLVLEYDSPTEPVGEAWDADE
ncbi:MAG: type II toxin-antitoxin system Phd/YefM family antitoxin [Verrucomicrobia bacterium]|nr:type II toxin-antitoxin system Phd/YefM family antitoxin [Verrucomicrobiota bacterium]MDA1085962.1 type II toxin-antitoxin system Phd/YefM family antitoxin [Verrucomicrobiota bacterium]